VLEAQAEERRGARDLVLGSRRKGDVGVLKEGPGSLSVVVLESRLVLLVVVREGSVSDLEGSDGVDVLVGEALLADEGTLGVGEGEDGSSELHDLLGGVLGDVSRSREEDSLALPAGGLALDVLDHPGDVVDKTVTGSLGSERAQESSTTGCQSQKRSRRKTGQKSNEPDERSSPRSTLAGKDTGELVLNLLVRSKHVSDLSSSDSNVSGGNVGVSADVSRELGHEGNAESSDLGIGSSLGVELGKEKRK
jgi:hypothetical protein